MDAILSLDASGQLAALSSGRISAAELLEASVRRWQATHAALNAVVATDLDRAREHARAIDDRRARGDTMGPLAGLPMTIKDTFDVDGLTASSGLESLRHGRRPDAVVVAHARQAGAVIWGKTNVPVMAGDFQTFNGLYGATNNPWDLARTPGGSSGGAAAALAARVTALEIGSDIGGSLRHPASFCGVYSHKPTWGVVSQIGHVPPKPGSASERDLNVVGPMARSARDLRLLLSVLEGGALAARNQAPVDLHGLRVGLWLDQPELALDPEIKAVLAAFAADLAREGATVTPLTSPVEMESLLTAYRTLLAGLVAQDLPPSQLAAMRHARGVAQIARKLGAGHDSWADFTLSYTISHLEWLDADEVRARAVAQMRRVFGGYDVILAPVGPVAAFPHDVRPFDKRKLGLSDGTTIPYLAALGWIALATACGLPATCIPAGQTRGGLPVGAQLIGPRGADARTLAIAETIEARLGGFVAPPAFETAGS